MRLAKVDATEEKELAEEFEISGFPTLKLFVNGDRKKPTDYNGTHTHTHARTCAATIVLDTLEMSEGVCVRVCERGSLFTVEPVHAVLCSRLFD